MSASNPPGGGGEDKEKNRRKSIVDAGKSALSNAAKNVGKLSSADNRQKALDTFTQSLKSAKTSAAESMQNLGDKGLSFVRTKSTKFTNEEEELFTAGNDLEQESSDEEQETAANTTTSSGRNLKKLQAAKSQVFTSAKNLAEYAREKFKKREATSEAKTSSSISTAAKNKFDQAMAGFQQFKANARTKLSTAKTSTTTANVSSNVQASVEEDDTEDALEVAANIVINHLRSNIKNAWYIIEDLEVPSENEEERALQEQRAGTVTEYIDDETGQTMYAMHANFMVSQDQKEQANAMRDKVRDSDSFLSLYMVLAGIAAQLSLTNGSVNIPEQETFKSEENSKEELEQKNQLRDRICDFIINVVSSEAPGADYQTFNEKIESILATPQMQKECFDLAWEIVQTTENEYQVIEKSNVNFSNEFWISALDALRSSMTNLRNNVKLFPAENVDLSQVSDWFVDGSDQVVADYVNLLNEKNGAAQAFLERIKTLQKELKTNRETMASDVVVNKLIGEGSSLSTGVQLDIRDFFEELSVVSKAPSGATTAAANGRSISEPGLSLTHLLTRLALEIVLGLAPEPHARAKARAGSTSSSTSSQNKQ